MSEEIGIHDMDCIVFYIVKVGLNRTWYATAMCALVTVINSVRVGAPCQHRMQFDLMSPVPNFSPCMLSFRTLACEK